MLLRIFFNPPSMPMSSYLKDQMWFAAAFQSVPRVGETVGFTLDDLPTHIYEYIQEISADVLTYPGFTLEVTDIGYFLDGTIYWPHVYVGLPALLARVDHG